MKTCFSEGKLMKQFGNSPPFLREPPFQLTPLFLSKFFMTPLLKEGREETVKISALLCPTAEILFQKNL